MMKKFYLRLYCLNIKITISVFNQFTGPLRVYQLAITAMSVYESYELYEIIGHGASCTVKRAVRKDTRQVFAAKLYQSNFLSAKNQIQMLIRLDHPNIVNIYEVFEEDDCIILILEFMEGGELFEAVGQRVSFTQSEVKSYMRVIVDAIRYCHEMNVVHRDIKPQNLLLSTNSHEGILKIADFGISKILSGEMLTTNCGTPVYMAPEIWKMLEYDAKVDVWSMGVVMYYLLSGTHPFDGDLDTIGDHIVEDQLSFDNNIWNLVSSKAIDLLRKMLEKDPEKRPTAVELTKHIWFSQMETQSKSSSDQRTQVSLSRTVHKIRRNNFKNKEKRAKNKLKDLSEAQNLSDTRFNFLVHSNSQTSNPTASQYAETYPMELQQ